MLVFLRRNPLSNDMNIINYLESGIKAEGTRQKTIAKNIANINTPGYRRVDIRFEEILTKALSTDTNPDMDKLEAEIYKPMNTPIKSNGNDVSIENEVGKMVKNSVLHKTYMLLLKKKYRQIEAAMQGR